MKILALFNSLLIPTALGYSLLLVVFRKTRLGFAWMLPLAYGLGLGILVFWMHLLGLLNIQFSFWIIAAPLIGAIVLLSAFLIFSKKYPPQEQTDLFQKASDQTKRRYSNIEKCFIYAFCAVLIVYIAFHVYHSFWRALIMPVYAWDAFSTITFKAKIFYYEGTLKYLPFLSVSGYPLFVPFVETWIAFNLGGWNEFLPKIIFPLCLISFLTIQYKFLSYYANRAWALVGCALLISSNLFLMHATISYRDFFLMYYTCTAFMLLFLWSKERYTPILILASLFAGFATLVKMEGVPYLGILIVVFFILNYSEKEPLQKEKVKRALQFLVPCITIWLSFQIFKFVVMDMGLWGGTGDKSSIILEASRLELIPSVMIAFADNLLLTCNWGITWFILLLSLPFLIKEKLGIEIKCLLISFLLFFGLYFCIAVWTNNYRWLAGEDEMTSLSRIFLHFFPLSTLLIVLLNFKELSFGVETPLKPLPQINRQPQTARKKKKRKKR